MIKASVSKSLSRSNKILMTDLVSTRLQAPAHGNVPSHKAPFRKKTRT